MAHYIAELIQDAEKATAEDRPSKMRACSEAILNLWKHQRELPDGKRPFGELEPILRALNSLDPDDDTPRYFRWLRFVRDEADENGESDPWLELINDLDYSAKLLIRYCITQAAKSALDKTADWVALAEAAGADDGIEFPVIRLIVDEEGTFKASDPDERERKRLEDRVERLEEFAKRAMALVSELRQRVQNTERTMGDS
jgi:hypothetical protein